MQTTGPPRRLLVLDDDALIGRAVQRVAESVGFEVRALQDAVSFLAAVDAWAPSHVAIDLVMPGMDGVEILQALASRRVTSRVIIMSGVGHRILDAARRSAHEHGLALVGALSKPFSASALQALLRDDLPVTPPRITSRHPAVAPFEPTCENLRAAIAQRELCLHYQPKIACADHRVTGFEALVRWHHPAAGLIPPDRFIPMAERSGCITDLTHHVFALAVGWLSRLPGHDEVSVSINLSNRDVRDLALADELERVCLAAGVTPSRVSLELTETSAMSDPVRGLDLLTRLRVKGFHLSLDDFGTGYSSMVQLTRLPFSELKIDRSFVMSALSSAESRTIIRTTIDLAHGLGLVAVAEGVEDGPTLDLLAELGCDLAQGYFIARPLPADAAMSWLAERAGPGSPPAPADG